MPYTLAQLDFIGAYLSVAIPPDFLAGKKQAELYQQRSAKLTERSGEIKGRTDAAEIESLINQANTAAEGKKFTDALQLLDQAEERLKQPDIPPEVVAALEELGKRKSALESSIARLKVLESPIGGEITSGLEAVAQAIRDRKVDDAGKRLGELEKMVTAFEQKKAAGEEAANKAQAIELAKLKERVEKLRKQIAVELEEIRKVVPKIEETTLAQPSVEGLKKLEESLAAVDKLGPAEQEIPLTELSKEIAALKAATDKAALDSAAVMVVRARVTQLEKKADAELAEADLAVKGIGEPSLQAPHLKTWEALSKRQQEAKAASDPSKGATVAYLTEREQEFSGLLPDLAKLKQEAAATKVIADKRAKLEELANAVRNEDVIKKAPKDANAQELLDAGLAAARQKVLDALSTREAREQKDIDAARKLLPEVKAAFDQAEEAAAKRLEEEDYKKAYLTIDPEVTAARNAVNGSPGAPQAQTDAFNKAVEALEALVTGKKWKLATAELKKVQEAAAAVSQKMLDGAAYYKEFEKIKVLFNAALNVVNNQKDALTEAMLQTFDDARNEMFDAMDAYDWPRAEGSLAALQPASQDVKDAGDAYAAYLKAWTDIDARFKEAQKLVDGAGVPSDWADDFRKADKAVDKAIETRNWVKVVEKVAALEAEIVEIEKIAKEGAAYYDEFKKIKPDFDAATDHFTKNQKFLPDSVVQQWEQATADLHTELDQEWDDAIKVIPAVKAAADEIQRVMTECYAFFNDFTPMGGDLDNMKAARVAGLPPAALAAFEKAENEVEQAKADRDWGLAKAKLVDLKREVAAVKAVLNDGAAYYTEFAKIQAEVSAAAEVFATRPEVLTEKLVSNFEKAYEALQAKVQAAKWSQAVPLLDPVKKAAVAVTKADGEHTSYREERAKFADNFKVAQLAYYNAGVSKPEGKKFNEAKSAVDKEAKAKNWAEAEAKLAALEAACEVVAKIVEAGKLYYQAFAPIEQLCDDADAALRLYADRLDVLATRYRAALKIAKEFAEKKKWSDAKKSIPAVEKTAKALVDLAEKFKQEREVFMAKFKKITNLPKARKLAAAPPKKLIPTEVKAFQARYIPFNDAKNAGRFVTAEKAIAPLQLAINALVAAKETYDAQKEDYEKELAAVADLAAAKTLAEAGLTEPLIIAKVKPFNQANTAVEEAAKREDWLAAKAGVPALKDAAAKLLEAKGGANGAKTLEDQGEIKKKIANLKSRTDAASDNGVPPFIDTLQKTVRDRLKAVNDLVDTGDYAGAEIGLKALLAELAAMEKAKADYAKYSKARDDAEKEIEKLTKKPLEPPALAQQSAKSLKATGDRATKQANAGKLDKATATLAAWVTEAKAWKEAKAAYDNLTTDPNPDETKLKNLVKLPGGGKVLDSLMSQMPDDKPQKFVMAAMTARFGFSVEQFKEKNPDKLEDLDPTKVISPDLPDKSLKAMYEILRKVPVRNVKGKVNKLIRFDEDAGGAAYSGGKKKIVWMYCGRANDPNGSQQKFNESGTIMPEGEDVDPDCEAVNDDPVPYFDFATLHEIGHAVDDKKGLMKPGTVWNTGPDWLTHSSDEVAAIAATHFKYDADFVKATLKDKNSKPPPDVTTVPSTSNDKDWKNARNLVVAWCQSVREGNALWNKASRSKQLVIVDRVYQEAYANDWVSYKFQARSKGISGYQFRSSAEWFAELYAAYFSKKLKPSHPLAAEFAKLKKPEKP
jgi:hypothetical protein